MAPDSVDPFEDLKKQYSDDFVLASIRVLRSAQTWAEAPPGTASRATHSAFVSEARKLHAMVKSDDAEAVYLVAAIAAMIIHQSGEALGTDLKVVTDMVAIALRDRIASGESFNLWG